MNTYARAAGITFGIMMLLLSVLITTETIMRKLFAISLGGVDELSGYAVAIGAPLAFTVALVDRAHIRINLAYQHMPLRLQAVLNAMAALSLGVLSVYLLYFTGLTIRGTWIYQSIAQTPWATPLIYPQTVWLIAMTVFAVAAVFVSLQAAAALVRRDWAGLNRHFGPETVEEELQAELDDLRQREDAQP